MISIRLGDSERPAARLPTRNIAAKKTIGLILVTSLLLSFRGNCRAGLYACAGLAIILKTHTKL